MSDSYEFLDTEHHKRLLDGLVAVNDKWCTKSLETGNKTAQILYTLFIEFTQDLMVVVERMVESNGDISDNEEILDNGQEKIS